MFDKTTVSITLPTIPRQVAEAIETARQLGATNEGIIDVCNDDFAIVGVNGAALRLIPFNTLLSALVNGYAVEKSAEASAREEIRDAYVYHSQLARSINDRHDGYADGIRFTLDTLGIKIEGVNA